MAALSLSALIHAQATDETTAADDPRRTLGIVTITASAPTSLPSEIPTTMQGITAAKIAENINATDSEDALKYFPSLLVRKRYIGDYNHAVLSSRASGTGNSARSAVYADGVLLSNYLGNGATLTPRWALVTPEEIERVDVMYGPFSAAYPGNSAGAVVDYVTRMPEGFEAHARAIVSTNRPSSYLRDAGGNQSGSVGFAVHIGSTGCATASGSPKEVPAAACRQPNTLTVRLDRFDVASQVVVADLRALLEGVNVESNMPKSAPGCMSGPDDSDCEAVMRNLGLSFGGQAPATQHFFRVEPR